MGAIKEGTPRDQDTRPRGFVCVCWCAIDFDWFTGLLGIILPCGPIVSVIEDEGIPNCIECVEDYTTDRAEAGWQSIEQTLEQELDENMHLLRPLKHPSYVGSPFCSKRS